MNYSKIRAFARENRINQTEGEKHFWEKVRARKFQGLKFNRQFVIKHSQVVSATKKYFIADFYCHKLKLIIEIDGGYHTKQVEQDQMRENILIDLGFCVLKFSNKMVLNYWDDVEKEMLECISSLDS